MPHSGGLAIEYKGPRQIGRHAEAVFMQLREVVKGIGLFVLERLLPANDAARAESILTPSPR